MLVMSLIVGAALGAVFGELLKAVLEIIKQATKFNNALINLQSTLVEIAPVIKEIEKLNNDLGNPKEELESLIREIKEGIKLVYDCSTIHWYDYPARYRHKKKLVALKDSLGSIKMQAQTARDQKETLLKVRRVFSAINKIGLVNREDTGASSSCSAGKVMESITGTKQEAGQSKAKAGNIQGMKQVRPNEQVFLDSSYSFDLKDLERASLEVLGEGSYGITFKSILEDGRAILVWKWLREVKVSPTEFEKQMEILITLLPEHPNVCPLRSYSYSGDEKLLIYDYIAGGSFSSLMHGCSQLDLKSRMKISLGAARGIAHIHSVNGVNGVPFVHGNIKSSNVLVTTDFQGCISDFGLTRLLPLSIIPSANTGYQAPEVKTGTLTQKSDVYSFGILLLEMLTGILPDEDTDLASLVEIQALEGLSNALFDEVICFDMMTLARECASAVPYMRPSMDEVVMKMEGIITSN